MGHNLHVMEPSLKNVCLRVFLVKNKEFDAFKFVQFDRKGAWLFGDRVCTGTPSDGILVSC